MGRQPMNTDSPPATAPPDFSGAHILVVDDELGTRHSLAAILRRQGWAVYEAASGQQALDLLDRQVFDLVVLDIRMPGMDGTEVLRRGRPRARETVFIFLTAYATLESAVAGIRGGAFDYLTKPSPVEEIIRTIRAGLTERYRRALDRDPVALIERAAATLRAAEARVPPGADGERFLQAGGIRIDTRKRLVVLHGQPLDLTATEHEIIVQLVRHHDRVLSCSELLVALRGLKLHEADARVYLRSHIRRLRTKLAAAGGEDGLVASVRGRGYTLAAS
jgi:DNA-binding response OmpR family regulator